MAETHEAYEVHIAAYRSEEFRVLLTEHFGDALGLNWIDAFDTDASYEVSVSSDRKDEFSALLRERFGEDAEVSWRATLDA